MIAYDRDMLWALGDLVDAIVDGPGDGAATINAVLQPTDVAALRRLYACLRTELERRAQHSTSPSNGANHERCANALASEPTARS